MSEPSHRSVGHMPTTMPVPTGNTALAALHRGTRGTPCVSDEDGDGDSSDEDEITGGRGLEAHLRSMHLHPMHTRYLGKSSEVKLVLSALSVKSGLAGRAPDTGDQLISVLQYGVPRRRPEYWQVYEVCIPSLALRKLLMQRVNSGRRSMSRSLRVSPPWKHQAPLPLLAYPLNRPASMCRRSLTRQRGSLSRLTICSLSSSTRTSPM
jgi:hypothetical protein